MQQCTENMLGWAILYIKSGFLDVHCTYCTNSVIILKQKLKTWSLVETIENRIETN